LQAPQLRRREIPQHLLAPTAKRIVKAIQRGDTSLALVDGEQLAAATRARIRRLHCVDDRRWHASSVLEVQDHAKRDARASAVARRRSVAEHDLLLIDVR